MKSTYYIICACLCQACPQALPLAVNDTLRPQLTAANVAVIAAATRTKANITIQPMKGTDVSAARSAACPLTPICIVACAAEALLRTRLAAGEQAAQALKFAGVLSWRCLRHMGRAPARWRSNYFRAAPARRPPGARCRSIKWIYRG